MKLRDVEKMINDGGVYCKRWIVPDNVPLPFSTLIKTGNGEDFAADDDSRYVGKMRLQLFLAVDVDDEETEYIVDKILNDNNINFTYSMQYLQGDAFCVKIYTFEVEED